MSSEEQVPPPEIDHLNDDLQKTQICAAKWTAGATVVIAVFSLVAAGVGYFQWRALRKTYELAVIAKQPSIAINSIKTKDPLLGRKTTIDTPIVVSFGNAGDSAAKVTEIAIEWIEAETLPSTPGYGHRRNYENIVPPTTGESSITTIPDDGYPLHLSAEQVIGINSGRKHLWVYGLLVSRDIFDRTGTFRFCGEWVGRTDPPGEGIYNSPGCTPAYWQKDRYK